MSEQKKTLFQAWYDGLGPNLYWLCPPVRRLIHWTPRWQRPAGFNPVVDERRELTIRMKLARGQKYLTRPDGWFLLYLLDEARKQEKEESE